MVFVETPYMVVVEAKRTEALERQDNQAQLCTQIRSWQIQWLLHSNVNSWLTLVVMKLEGSTYRWSQMVYIPCLQRELVLGRLIRNG